MKLLNFGTPPSWIYAPQFWQTGDPKDPWYLELVGTLSLENWPLFYIFLYTSHSRTKNEFPLLKDKFLKTSSFTKINLTSIIHVIDLLSRKLISNLLIGRVVMWWSSDKSVECAPSWLPRQVKKQGKRLSRRKLNPTRITTLKRYSIPTEGCIDPIRDPACTKYSYIPPASTHNAVWWTTERSSGNEQF